MADLRADLAALLAKVERMTPGEWDAVEWDGPGITRALFGPAAGDAVGFCGDRDGGIANARGIVALRNAAPRYLAALASIAEIVAAHDSRVDYAGDALDEIRAVLDGAVTP